MATVSVSAGAAAPSRAERRWDIAEQAVALVCAALVGSHYLLTRQVAIGYLPALLLIPVWWPVVRRVRAARWTFVIGAAAIVSGLVLAALHRGEREFSRLIAFNVTFEILGVLASVGLLCWAMWRVGVPKAGVAFALGMAVAARPGSRMDPADYLRLVYAPPLSLLVLFLAVWTGRRSLESLALVALTLFCGLSGSRSLFAVGVISCVVHVWWQWRHRHGRTGTLPLPVLILILVALAWGAYRLGEALLLQGALGEAARLRTQWQIQNTGSLILGGRPEMAATMALMADQPAGYGAGILPAFADLQVARESMAAIGYDPLNGYVESYMFGANFRLHSMVGDLWSSFGIAGIVLVVAILWQGLRMLQQGARPGYADTVVLVLVFTTLWNAGFSPWFASLPAVIPLLALGWLRSLEAPRPATASAPLTQGVVHGPA